LVVVFDITYKVVLFGIFSSFTIEGRWNGCQAQITKRVSVVSMKSAPPYDGRQGHHYYTRMRRPVKPP